MQQKHKKTIGIFMPSIKNGGVFQYALSIADSLINYSDTFKCVILHYESEDPEASLDLKPNRKVQFVPVPNLSFSLFRKAFHFLGMAFGLDLLLIKDFYPIFKKNNIDILIYPTPSTFDFFPYKTSFVSSIPNLMHRYYPNFPEFGLKQRFTRDIVYRHYASRSVLSTVDSKQGIEDLHKFLNIPREKIRAISYTPAGYIFEHKDMEKEDMEEILKDHRLPTEFIFYPAQFWHHKNHIRLIKAFHLIKKNHGIKIPLVLVGSAKGHYEKIYQEMMALIKKENMMDQVVHLGYVSEKEIVALYKRSTALVFPSLIGPTGIPFLEAMVLGTPTICSNLFEIPNQIGDAGVLFDPFDINDMADKIYKVWTDEDLRKKMAERGRERTKDLTLENNAKKWEKIMAEALDKR